MSEAWERLDGETAREYEAFTWYRDLLPSVRSIRNAAIKSYGHTLLNGNPKRHADLTAEDRRTTGNRAERWERHSVNHEWQTRARMWDDHLDKIRRDEQIEAVREMSQRHANLGRALVGAAIEALNDVVRGTNARRVGRPEDRVLLAFAAEGAKMERAAYGLNVWADETDGRVANPQDVPQQLLDEGPEVAAQMARLALARAQARRRAEREKAQP